MKVLTVTPETLPGLQSADGTLTASGTGLPRRAKHSGGPAPARTNWPDGAILLCRECKRSEAKHLRKAIARRLKALGIRSIRPLVTSCQDLCPGKGTAVSIVARGQAVRTYVVRDEREAAVLVDAVLGDAP